METTQTTKQFSEQRNERAKQILQNGNPQILDENTYLVPSQFDSSKKYEVTHLDSYSCNCPDFQRRCNIKCKQNRTFRYKKNLFYNLCRPTLEIL